MTVNYQWLYEEFEGTLSFGNDPSGRGSQANTYGYRAGQGTDLRGKFEIYVATQNDITVDRTSADNVGAGKVNELIPYQAARDSITPDEYNANCRPTSGDGEIVIGQKASLRQWIELLMGGLAESEGWFVYTDRFQSQILETFPNNTWPDTRANLIGIRSRNGSRSEEQWGYPITMDDMRAAERWREEFKPGSPSLNG